MRCEKNFNFRVGNSKFLKKFNFEDTNSKNKNFKTLELLTRIK